MMIDGINVLTMVPTGAALKTASGEGASFTAVFGQVLDPGLLKEEQNSEGSSLPAGSPFEFADEDTDTGREEDAAVQGRIELCLLTIPCQLDLSVDSHPVSGEATGNVTLGSKSSFDWTVAEQRVSLPIGKEQMTAKDGADKADRLTAAVVGAMDKEGAFDSYADLRTTTTAIDSPTLPTEAVKQDTAAVAIPAVFSESQPALTKTGAINLAQGRETAQATDGSTVELSGKPSQSGLVRDMISQYRLETQGDGLPTAQTSVYRLETQGDGLPTAQTSVNEAFLVNNDDKLGRQLSQALKDYQEQSDIGDTAKTAQSPAAKTGWADNGNTAFGKHRESRDYQGKQASDQPVEQSTKSQDNRVNPTAAFNLYQVAAKVSEAALPKNQPIDNLANLYTQISDRVANRIKDGGQESFKMKLFPEGLGEVQVNLILKENKITLDIITDTAATQKLLETQSAELKAALLNKNYDVSVVNISSWTESHSANNNAFSFWGGDSGEQSDWQEQTRYANEYQEEAADHEQIQPPMRQPVLTGILNSWA